MHTAHVSSPPRTLFIAEAGVNHNGSLSVALEMVEAAAHAGADIVKFQSFSSEALASAAAPKAAYQQRSTGAEGSQREMLRQLELDEEAHRQLAAACQAKGIEFLSTPFDLPSLAMLTRLEVRRLKISSGDLTNAQLLHAAARTQLPIIVSTGMATLAEIEEALGILAAGYLGEMPGRSPRARAAYVAAAPLRERVSILHCVSQYPAPPAEVNLRAMQTIAAAFGLPVGYSDHTAGNAVALAATALGASILEKHFTLDRSMPGPDHQASLDVPQLIATIAAVREVESALGDGRKMPRPSELDTVAVARRSLVTLRAVRRGELFTTQNLGAKRPGTGISALRYYEWLGCSADRDYAADELIGGPCPDDVSCF